MEKLYLCCNLYIWWLTSGEINADYVLATFLLDSVPNCPNYARAWWQYSQINMVVVYLAVSWSYHRRKCLCKISVCVTRVFCCSKCPQWLRQWLILCFWRVPIITSTFNAVQSGCIVWRVHLACSEHNLNGWCCIVWRVHLACLGRQFNGWSCDVWRVCLACSEHHLNGCSCDVWRVHLACLEHHLNGWYCSNFL